MLVNDGFRPCEKTPVILNRAVVLKERLLSRGTELGSGQCDPPPIGKDTMATAYAVGPIKAMQVERAYCLIETLGYHIDLGAWRQICAAALFRKHPSPYVEEVAIAENVLGYVNGIAIMRARCSARLGLYLSVPVFVVASAGDAPGVCDALFRYVSATAHHKHCSAVHIASFKPDRWPVANGKPDVEADGIFIPLR